MRALLLALLVACPALAPTAPPRIGLGFDVTSAFYPQDVVPDGPSIGVRARAALPVNADVSVAASLGVGAHILSGGDDATFVLNPQTSVIVSLPSRRRARGLRYVLGGVGGFLPLSGGGGGASVHAGFGYAVRLSETSVFTEFNPSLIVGEETSVVVLAVRGGVIF